MSEAAALNVPLPMLLAENKAVPVRVTPVPLNGPVAVTVRLVVVVAACASAPNNIAIAQLWAMPLIFLSPPNLCSKSGPRTTNVA